MKYYVAYAVTSTKDSTLLAQKGQIFDLPGPMTEAALREIDAKLSEKHKDDSIIFISGIFELAHDL